MKVNLHRALPLNLPHTFTPRFEIFTLRIEIFTRRVETFTPRMQIAVCKIAAVDVGLECISRIEVIEKSLHFLAFCYRASMQNNMQGRQQTSKPGPFKQVGCNN